MQLSDPDAIPRIAELLGAEARLAPYSTEAQPAYEITLPETELGPPLEMTLWPSLARVDVRLGECLWVFKGVDEVELHQGIEVLFRRREPPGFLFVSVKGRVAMAA